jgi:hypothetical protein
MKSAVKKGVQTLPENQKVFTTIAVHYEQNEKSSQAAAFFVKGCLDY